MMKIEQTSQANETRKTARSRLFLYIQSMFNKGMIPVFGSQPQNRGQINNPVRLPDQGIYGRHGAEKISTLLIDVYHVLAKSSIHEMFSTDLAELEASARKSALFWMTACGGPPLYEDAYGPPRMKARHTRFKIGKAERDVWVSCWMSVLDQAESRYGFSADEIRSLRNYIEDFSLWMINT